MSALWYKEWREFTGSTRTLLLRFLFPLLVAGPLLEVSWLRLPAILAVVAYFGTYQTAGQVARERISGLLPRLALTPVHPRWLVLQKVLARSLLLLLQLGPVLVLAQWLGARADRLLTTALPLIPTACALGVYLGLHAPTRRWATLIGLLTVPGAVGVAGLLGMPHPGDPTQIPLPLVGMSSLAPLHPSTGALWTLAALVLTAALGAAPRILGLRWE